MFGWQLGPLEVIDPAIFGLTLAFSGAVIGGMFAALLGAAGHALMTGRRDFIRSDSSRPTATIY